eukprot:3735106-Prymnesium_polylepis.1
MEKCRVFYGIPVITFDEMLLDRSTARRRMAFFLRGAGGPDPEAALSFEPALFSASNSLEGVLGGVEVPFASRSSVEPANVPLTRHDDPVSLVREVEFREVCAPAESPERTWLALLCPSSSADCPEGGLEGRSSLVVTRHELTTICRSGSIEPWAR